MSWCVVDVYEIYGDIDYVLFEMVFMLDGVLMDVIYLDLMLWGELIWWGEVDWWDGLMFDLEWSLMIFESYSLFDVSLFDVSLIEFLIVLCVYFEFIGMGRLFGYWDGWVCR